MDLATGQETNIAPSWEFPDVSGTVVVGFLAGATTGTVMARDYVTGIEHTVTTTAHGDARPSRRWEHRSVEGRAQLDARHVQHGRVRVRPHDRAGVPCLHQSLHPRRGGNQRPRHRVHADHSGDPRHPQHRRDDLATGTLSSVRKVPPGNTIRGVDIDGDLVAWLEMDGASGEHTVYARHLGDSAPIEVYTTYTPPFGLRVSGDTLVWAEGWERTLAGARIVPEPTAALLLVWVALLLVWRRRAGYPRPSPSITASMRAEHGPTAPATPR